MKLEKGLNLENFTFDTPYESGLNIKDVVSRVRKKTAIIFLRYYGCTICQYDIHLMAKSYDLIKQVDGQILVVLQSLPENISKQMEKTDLPFDIICDPDQILYKKYEILPAKSMAKMADFKIISKISKAKSAGFEHGEYEGEELQLPAICVVDNNLLIEYAHYAKTISDMPDIQKIKELLV